MELFTDRIGPFSDTPESWPEVEKCQGSLTKLTTPLGSKVVDNKYTRIWGGAGALFAQRTQPPSPTLSVPDTSPLSRPSENRSDAIRAMATRPMEAQLIQSTSSATTNSRAVLPSLKYWRKRDENHISQGKTSQIYAAISGKVALCKTVGLLWKCHYSAKPTQTLLCTSQIPF